MSKYNSEYNGYIISTEAVLCASSLALTPVFAPLICAQFSKDVIRLGKQALIANQVINGDGLLAKTIDETMETLVFSSALQSVGEFGTTGWTKVGLKTLAGLVYKLADEWYNIAEDFHRGEEILIYTSTYTAQYSMQEVIQNSILPVMSNTNARIASHSTARAVGSTLRDYYNYETIKLEHVLNGFVKGSLYGSKLFFNLFAEYISPIPAHYVESIIIEDIGVYLNTVLHSYAETSQESIVH